MTKTSEMILLGTGNAMVTRCYNTCFAIRNGEEYFLVDAGGGNGIMAQLEKAEIPYTGMHEMFVTHGHTDHVLGVIWVIRKIGQLMTQDQYKGNFIIYCHDELVRMITIFCEMVLPAKLLRLLGNRIIIREVTNGETVKTTGMKLTFFDIESSKLKQFGFSAVLPDGQCLVCLGDEPCSRSGMLYAVGCDWLLSEAFCLYCDREKFKPYEKHHTTVMDAARTAEELGVKNLLLYHTEDTQLAERKKLYSEEASSVFSGKVYVPDDLERICLSWSV